MKQVLIISLLISTALLTGMIFSFPDNISARTWCTLSAVLCAVCLYFMVKSYFNPKEKQVDPTVPSIEEIVEINERVHPNIRRYPVTIKEAFEVLEGEKPNIKLKKPDNWPSKPDDSTTGSTVEKTEYIMPEDINPVTVESHSVEFVDNQPTYPTIVNPKSEPLDKLTEEESKMFKDYDEEMKTRII